MQVSVLPPPPRGWEHRHEWTAGKKSHLYWTLKTNFYAARNRVMHAEISSPVTFRPKCLNKKPVSPGTLRRLLIKKQREENGWTFPGPLEPDLKYPLRQPQPM